MINDIIFSQEKMGTVNVLKFQTQIAFQKA